MKQLICSVTSKDCEWQFIRGTGNGGSNRNKTSTAVRCTHKASGAVGFAQDSRSQPINKAAAFRRMASTKEFKVWLQKQAGQYVLTEQEIAARVAEDMKQSNLKIEYYDPNE